MRLADIVRESDREVYREGFEDGWEAGYLRGGWSMMDYIMDNPDAIADLNAYLERIQNGIA